MSLSSSSSSPGKHSGNHHFTFSGRDSAFSDGEENESPPLCFADTIGTSLDEYACAAQLGRASFCKGDARATIRHFDQALEIELQTELECMYDTSLGYVSGLLRREVDSRLHQLATGPTSRAPAGGAGRPPDRRKMLQELEKAYRHAEGESERKPTAPTWYLRMGAALCMVDEWEKARRIYKDGLLACKDKAELRQAVDNLNTIEKLTAGTIVPQDVGSPALVYASGKNHAGRPRKNRALSASSIKRHVIKKLSTSESPRRGSEDVFSQNHRERHRSNSLEDVSPTHQAVTYNTAPNSPGKSKKKKHLRRPNSGLLSSSKHPEPQVPYDDRLAWADSFSTESEIASGRPDFVSSAVVHMRRLALTSSSTVEDESDDSGGAELQSKGEEYRDPFRAIGTQKDTIRVDLSDDSELEFD